MRKTDKELGASKKCMEVGGEQKAPTFPGTATPRGISSVMLLKPKAKPSVVLLRTQRQRLAVVDIILIWKALPVFL